MANNGFKKGWLHKKSHLEHRLQQDVLEDGVAHIPCKVGGIEDIVSKFSIKGRETLDLEFVAYVIEFVDFIPIEYPIVLDIYGPKFTPEQQEVIRRTIRDDIHYLNGRAKDISWRRTRMFIIMIMGAILTGVLLQLAILYAPDVPKEWSYVIFWLFADSVVRYLFIEKVDYRQEQASTDRLVDLSVEFRLAEDS